MFGAVLAVQTAGPTVQKLKNFNQISIKFTAGKCPQRDITCADGHENVVGIEFSVEAAQVL